MSRTDPPRRREPLWSAALLAAGIAISIGSGCSSVLSQLPEKVGGLPEGTPERSDEQAAYPQVHAMPPKRSEAVLTDKQREKLEADLAAAREDASRRAADAEAGATGKPAKLKAVAKVKAKAKSEANAEAAAR
jgi:hypothetical protein